MATPPPDNNGGGYDNEDGGDEDGKGEDQDPDGKDKNGVGGGGDDGVHEEAEKVRKAVTKMRPTCLSETLTRYAGAMVDLRARVFGPNEKLPAYGAYSLVDMRAAKALPRAIETGAMTAFANRWWAAKRAYAHQWPALELAIELMKVPGPFVGGDDQPLGPEYVGEYMALSLTLAEKGRPQGAAAGLLRTDSDLQSLGSEKRLEEVATPSAVSTYLKE